jgi:ankyrin repeat protein
MLKELPPTLDATYTRMLERIGPAVSEDALTLLRWLAYAARPVTLAELQTAVTISPEDDEVDFEDEGDFRDSLRILAGLIVFSNGADSKKDGGDAEHDKASLETKDLTPGAHVRLAHFSVKEYLESARISRSPASFFRLEAGACHRFLARSCLTYLMSYSKSGEKTSRELDLDKFHLLNYAADKWHEHSRLQSGDDVSREVALLECKNAVIDWLEVDSFQFNGVHLSVYNVPRMPSICYAVYLHLPRVVKKLLEAGQNANAVGPYYKPLLVVATENEDQTTVELLLAHGADVDMAPENQSGNALWCAASRGLLLTELMVNNGANVNFDGFSGTALSAACKADDQSVVHFLLERGARIDTAALRGASSHGHTEMVKLLVAKGANVNDLSTHTTSLMAAAESGHIGVMEVLIDAGADVNAKDSGALLGALLCGHEHAVALLEAKGAYELTSKRLDQALFETCYERSCRAFYTHREKAIDLLLDRGANANGGALSFALERGDEHVVGLLEARGAKLTLESLNYILTATFHVYRLQRRHHQCEAVLNLSLDRGADINAMDSSVLLAALESGQDDMVALLEAKGAKKPTLEQLGKSLISVCDDHRHHCPSRAVELLLDRGADVSAEDSSALLGALWSGQENLAALLEAKGAKKPTLEQLGKSLISVCDDQYHRCPNIAVGLLLDRGADVSAKDSSALLDAMRSGQEDTVALLEAKGANKPTLEQLKAALIEVRGKLYHRNLDNAVQMLLDRGADGNTADSNFQDLPDSVA